MFWLVVVGQGTSSGADASNFGNIQPCYRCTASWTACRRVLEKYLVEDGQLQHPAVFHFLFEVENPLAKFMHLAFPLRLQLLESYILYFGKRIDDMTRV
jgi:hypothetical protein